MIILQSPYFWIITSLALTLLTKSLAIALCFGSAIALLWGNPAKKVTGMLSKYLLQLAVILFGFGLQLNVILKVGYSSIGITFFSISTTLFLGWVLGKLFKVERSVSILISSGTAICGGSAIAAMAPAIGASQGQTAIAMAVVFLLNGIARHDTSSVVGATAIYGAEALAIGTTIKLTRALWILPLSFLGAKLNKSDSKAKVPWFLFGFLLAALIRSLFPGMEDLWHLLAIKR